MDERDRTIEQLNSQISEMEVMIQTLTDSNKALTDSNESLTSTIEGLQRTIKELQETIKELRRQLDQNSHNSSKPPSSDGYHKPSPKSQRTKTGRKPGGQKGHCGSNMTIPHAPDGVIKHPPEKCKTCPHLAQCLQDDRIFSCAEKRYTVDAVVKTKVTEHQSLKAGNCPCGEEPGTGSFPEDVKAYVQYGDSVSVLVVFIVK